MLGLKKKRLLQFDQATSKAYPDEVRLTFIYTALFDKKVEDLLDEQGFIELETELLKNPEVGKVMSGTGGIRKMRFMLGNIGKRGGLRILYVLRDPKVYFVFVYSKNKMANISPEQKKILAQIAKELK
jgi:hypothetical protein